MHDVTLTISLDGKILADHIPAQFVFERHGPRWGAHLNIPLLSTGFLAAYAEAQGTSSQPDGYTVEVHGRSGESVRGTGFFSYLAPGTGGFENVEMQLNLDTDDLEHVQRVVK
ncbi:hypothetical protein [Deinococcus sp. PEB2-67]